MRVGHVARFLHDVIDSFHWAATPEGGEYWSDVGTYLPFDNDFIVPPEVAAVVANTNMPTTTRVYVAALQVEHISSTLELGGYNVDVLLSKISSNLHHHKHRDLTYTFPEQGDGAPRPRVRGISKDVMIAGI